MSIAETRIGRVARSIATVTRRSLLGTSAGGLAALVGGLLPWGRADAAPCQALGQWCDTSDACCFNSICQHRACRCPPGWDSCGSDRCHYLRLAHYHCGACGVACDPDGFCANGICI